jgi:hypothetical protein
LEDFGRGAFVLTLIAGNKMVRLLIKPKVSGEICANVRYYIKSTILDDASCRKKLITRKHFGVRQAMQSVLP